MITTSDLENDLIIRAAALAQQLHAKQPRKASLVPNVPYFCHLLNVAGMVQEAGGSDEMVAAAFLHDVLEDTDCSGELLAQLMPPGVCVLVGECTEIGTSGPVKADWKPRKDAYIAHLSLVSAGALLISVADKLHSLRGLKQVVRERGDEAYRNLVKSAPTVAERKISTLWFNDQVLLAAWRRLRDLQEHDGIEERLAVGIEALLKDFRATLDYLEA